MEISCEDSQLKSQIETWDRKRITDFAAKYFRIYNIIRDIFNQRFRIQS